MTLDNYNIECRASDFSLRDDTEATRTSASLVSLTSSLIYSFTLRTYIEPFQETTQKRSHYLPA